MTRFLTVLAPVLAAMVLPAAAAAQVIEIGATKEAATPACPSSPCLAVTQTTGYQAKVGATRGLMIVPKSGRIVAWTVSLGKPGTKQTAFFENLGGGPAQAGITVLRPGAHLFSRVLAAGPLQALEPYFGSTVQFPLVRSISVAKGQLIALTIPTWAPVLAVGLPGDTSWRSSRAKSKCDDTQSRTQQTDVNDLAQYYCLYRTARLTYSATLVTYPEHPKG